MTTREPASPKKRAAVKKSAPVSRTPGRKRPAPAKPTRPKARPKARPKVKPAPRPAPRPAPVAPARPPAPAGPALRRSKAKPAKVKRPKLPRARVLSQNPEAVRSRKRRAAERAKRQSANEKRRRQRAEKRAIEEARKEERKRRRGGGIKRKPKDERELALGWLEAIRDRIASVFAVSLSYTEAEPGARTPWLVVGRYDPIEDIGYSELGAAFEICRDDLVLEAMIHPQRLSQIRIVYEDPNAKRGEGDSVVSSIGAWEAVISDVAHELVGGDPEEPAEESLAHRYAQTRAAAFYVYFSSELQHYETRGPWTVKLGG